MSTTVPPGSEPDASAQQPVDYHAGFHEPATDVWPPAADDSRREWTLVALGLTALVAVIAAAIAVVALATGGESPTTTVVKQKAAPAAAAAPAAETATPTLAQDKGIAFEEFTRVDPTLRGRGHRWI